MNTGSRDEQVMLSNIGRIAAALERIATCAEETVYGVTADAAALERIANCAEETVYGVTADEVVAAKHDLKDDAEALSSDVAP